MMKTIRYPNILWLTIFAMFLAPWWVPRLRQLTGFSLFLAPDSLIWLGATLLLGVLCQNFLPDGVVKRFNAGAKYLKSHWAALSPVLLGALLAGLYGINRFILHRFMNSADEFCGWFLAECIRSGRFWAPSPPVADFFEMMHVANMDGKWFGIYPPGWPLLYALGLKFHFGDWVNPLLGIVSLFFLFQVGKKIYGFAASVLGISTMALTPFFLLNHASYYSHGTCFLSVSIFLYTYFKWTERKHSLWAGLCAFAIGYGLATRYLTMLAIAGPFLIYELIQLLLRKARWTRSHLVFGAILTAMLGLNLSYNHALTGSFFDVPSHYYHHWERLGFQDNYTILNALQYILARFFFIMDWIPPAMLLFYLISLGQKGNSGIRQLLFRWGFFYLVLAYIFYYCWGGNQYGPRYYLEALPFLALSAAEIAQKWWSAGNIKIQKFLLGILIAALLGNGYLLYKQGAFYNKVSLERKALYDLADETIQTPAIVFIHGYLGDTLVMAEEDAVRNHPDLAGKILYAHDLGERNGVLKRLYPNRVYYLGSYDRTVKQARLELMPK